MGVFEGADPDALDRLAEGFERCADQLEAAVRTGIADADSIETKPRTAKVPTDFCRVQIIPLNENCLLGQQSI